MIFHRRWGPRLCISAAVGTIASAAAAEPLRFHLEGGAARAVSGTQQSETGLGGIAAGTVELGLTKEPGVQLELSALTLGAGDAPPDPTLATKGASSGQTLMAGLRLRPFVSKYDG